MVDKKVRAGFYVCASICGQDGIISEAEELGLVQNFIDNFGLNESELDQLFDDFFNSTNNFDDYLKQVLDTDLRVLILKIAKDTAASDELEIRENIALKRAGIIWELDLCQEQ